MVESVFSPFVHVIVEIIKDVVIGVMFSPTTNSSVFDQQDNQHLFGTRTKTYNSNNKSDGLKTTYFVTQYCIGSVLDWWVGVGWGVCVVNSTCVTQHIESKFLNVRRKDLICWIRTTKSIFYLHFQISKDEIIKLYLAISIKKSNPKYYLLLVGNDVIAGNPESTRCQTNNVTDCMNNGRVNLSKDDVHGA